MNVAIGTAAFLIPAFSALIYIAHLIHQIRAYKLIIKAKDGVISDLISEIIEKDTIIESL